MARCLPSGLVRPEVCYREPFSQYLEYQGSVPSLRKFKPICFDRTAEDKRLVDFIVQSPGDEQHLVVLGHIHHYRLTVNKSTWVFVKNIVNYAAHLLAVTGQ